MFKSNRKRLAIGLSLSTVLCQLAESENTMTFIILMDPQPTTAGSAPISCVPPSSDDQIPRIHEGVITLPVHPVSAFVPLLGGTQFVCIWGTDPEDPEYNYFVLGGTHKFGDQDQPFLIWLKGKCLNILLRDGEEAFYKSIIPETVLALMDEGAAVRFEGGLLIVKIADTWDDLTADMIPGLDGELSEERSKAPSLHICPESGSYQRAPVLAGEYDEIEISQGSDSTITSHIATGVLTFDGGVTIELDGPHLLIPMMNLHKDNRCMTEEPETPDETES